MWRNALTTGDNDIGLQRGRPTGISPITSHTHAHTKFYKCLIGIMYVSLARVGPDARSQHARLKSGRGIPNNVSIEMWEILTLL